MQLPCDLFIKLATESATTRGPAVTELGSTEYYPQKIISLFVVWKQTRAAEEPVAAGVR